MKAEKTKLSGEKGKKISNQINGTYLSVCSQNVRILLGNITRIILCPSSGGKGIRLKTINDRFRITSFYQRQRKYVIYSETKRSFFFHYKKIFYNSI